MGSPAEIPDFEVPQFHQPTTMHPPSRPISLAEMPDAYFAEAPSVVVRETGVIAPDVASIVHPGEMDKWAVLQETRAQAAERRLSKRPHETRPPADQREAATTDGRSKNPHSNVLPFARAIGTRPTPQEIEKAQDELRSHSARIDTRNKRQS